MHRYVAVSGFLFLIVSFAHLFRILLDWQITINGQELPMSISYIAIALTLVLTAWAFKINK